VLGPLSTAVIVVCFLIYLYRVIMWNQLKARRDGKT